MICQVCVKLNLRSVVTDLGGSVTCMSCPSYYDEEGRYHLHDTNIRTGHFECSNGHTGRHTSQARCPVADCDWNAKQQDMMTWI